MKLNLVWSIALCQWFLQFYIDITCPAEWFQLFEVFFSILQLMHQRYSYQNIDDLRLTKLIEYIMSVTLHQICFWVFLLTEFSECISVDPCQCAHLNCSKWWKVPEIVTYNVIMVRILVLVKRWLKLPFKFHSHNTEHFVSIDIGLIWTASAYLMYIFNFSVHFNLTFLICLQIAMQKYWKI